MLQKNHLFVVGMNHKIADISIREKFYIPMDLKIEALKNSPFKELLILSTCNRTEFYIVDDAISGEKIIDYICGLVKQPFNDFLPYFYTQKDKLAVEHVMQVCAGLDSVAMGEDQILHQISRAYETAHSLQATGLILNKLFQSTIHTTKRIKTETNLSKLSCSIPFLAMKQIQKSFCDLENKKIYIVGLGEMGSLMLKYVEEYTTHLYASSRTFANAEKFTDVLTPIPFEKRNSVLDKVDILILCSACANPIFTVEDFKKNRTKETPFLVLDLGSPRNAESAIGELKNIHYVCVDELQKMVDENRKLRIEEMENAKKILQEGIEEFLNWQEFDDVSKQFFMLSQKVESLAHDEFSKISKSLSHLKEEEKNKIEKYFYRLAKKFSNEFFFKVRENNSIEECQKFLEILTRRENE